VGNPPYSLIVVASSLPSAPSCASHWSAGSVTHASRVHPPVTEARLMSRRDSGEGVVGVHVRCRGPFQRRTSRSSSGLPAPTAAGRTSPSPPASTTPRSGMPRCQRPSHPHPEALFRRDEVVEVFGSLGRDCRGDVAQGSAARSSSVVRALPIGLAFSALAPSNQVTAGHQERESTTGDRLRRQKSATTSRNNCGALATRPPRLPTGQAGPR
jgi:hypothetical protein